MKVTDTEDGTMVEFEDGTVIVLELLEDAE